MVKNADTMWMEQALILAERAQERGEVPVGALLVQGNKIVGQGWNCSIAHTDPTAHAEIMALREAGVALKNYRLCHTTLYVTLEPCAMCLGAMVHARIARLVFGAFDYKSGVLTSAASLLDQECFNHRFSWQGGVLADECAVLLSEFFKFRRAQAKALKRQRADE